MEIDLELEQKAIKEIKEGKDLSKNIDILTQFHTGIIVNKINSFHLHKNFEKEDLMDRRSFYVYHAAKKYDPNRNIKFSTFLGAVLGNTMKSTLKKNSRRIQTDPLDYYNSETGEYVDCSSDATFEESYDIHDIEDAALNVLSERKERDVEIYKLRAFEGKTWESIAECLRDKGYSITYERCRMIFNDMSERVKFKLKREIEK